MGFCFHHVVNLPDSMGMPVICPLLPMWGSFHGDNQRTGNQQGVITSISDLSNADIPEKYILFQNYPNLFNPTTMIKYGIPADGPVDIAIYNITGQRVRQLVGFEM